MTDAFRKRLFIFGLLLSAAASFPLGASQEEAFAGLTVVAHGDQEIDIFTGITTLPEGGQVIDRENGVTLTAEHIRYREGEFVEARGVEVSGEFGIAHSEEVYIDLVEGRLNATGAVRYERDELGLNATSLHYFPEDGVVRFEGPVTGVGADFEATAALYDRESGALLLAAPYRYQDTLFELSSERAGALLSLTPAAGNNGTLLASSRVAPEVLARLEPYLSPDEEDDAASSADGSLP